MNVKYWIQVGMSLMCMSLCLRAQSVTNNNAFTGYKPNIEGKMSDPERKALLESRKQELLKWDKNGDGKIDAGEREAWKRARQEYYLKIKKQKQIENPNNEAARLLKKHDVNHDGHLDQTEKLALEADLAEVQARKQSKNAGK